MIGRETQSVEHGKLFLLLRHAETVLNQRGVWHGTEDESISQLGIRTAQDAGKRLSKIVNATQTNVVTSDLRRAVETAEIIRNALRTESIVKDPLLRERDMGKWAGKSAIEVEQTWPGLLVAWEDGAVGGPPGGETDEEVAARGLRSLLKHADSNDVVTVVITHGGVLRSINRSLTRRQPPVPHLGGYWLVLESEARFSMGDQIILGDPTAVPRT